MSTTLQQHQAPVEALPDDGDPPGTFRAIVAVYGNRDKHGDRILEGAFEKSLAKWRASGKRLPIIFAHNWGDGSAFIGSADPHDVVSVPGRGLLVKAKLNLGTDVADSVYAMLKANSLEWSFGYRAVQERRGSDGANELVEIDLFECGPCLKGVNPDTELLSIKSNDPIHRLRRAIMQEQQPERKRTNATVIGEWSLELRGHPHRAPLMDVVLKAAVDATDETADHLIAKSVDAYVDNVLAERRKDEEHRQRSFLAQQRARGGQIDKARGLDVEIKLGANGRVTRGADVAAQEERERQRAIDRARADDDAKEAERARIERLARSHRDGAPRVMGRPQS